LRLLVVPEDKREAFVKELCTGLPDLPPSMQKRILEGSHQALSCPEALRLFRDWAQRNTEALPREAKADADAMAALGLRNWYSTDSAGARPALLKEILRLHPRFGLRLLGVLPDKTLPEADATLAAALDEGVNPTSDTMQLLERYATGKLLPDVLAFEDKALAAASATGCGQQFALAYILRVDPEAARPRIEKAVGLRSGNGCYQFLLGDIAKLDHGPVLEELAMAHLDDADPAVVSDAAKYLGKFGSARVEKALWDRYERWSQEWGGRAAEMQGSLLVSDEEDAMAASLRPPTLGRLLGDALTNAPAWTLDEAKLERVRTLAVANDARQMAELALTSWRKKPWSVACRPVAPWSEPVAGQQAVFRVLQYQARSLDELVDKMSQFPRGSSFNWLSRAAVAACGEEALKEVSARLAGNGITVVAANSSAPPALN
jgi:hypothetical protein